MLSGIVVFCRFLVVLRRVLVMFRCFAMMLCYFLRHDFLSSRDSRKYYSPKISVLTGASAGSQREVE
jgi:hypothetical protein